MKYLSDYIDLEQVRNFEKDKRIEELTPIRKKLFFKRIYKILDLVTNSYGVSIEDMLTTTWAHKENISYSRKICQYQIIQENLNFFNHKYAVLTGKLFNLDHSTVIRHYNDIGDLKLNSDLGKKVKEIQNHLSSSSK